MITAFHGNVVKVVAGDETLGGTYTVCLNGMIAGGALRSRVLTAVEEVARA